jgi:glycosyltransferase involved in cell wall biosynthesis
MRPKVLLIAEAANPEWVSVPLVGWSLSAALREVADVHLVTQIRNRAAILRAGLVEGQDFTAIDTESLARPMWRLAKLLRMGKGKGWTMVTAINSVTYPYFEHLVWRRFGSAIEAHKYDIVHRVTPLTPTANSLVAPRCQRAGVPFVMGPINGGVPWPPGFAREIRREREWLSYLRGLYKMLPGRKSTLAAASVIIAGSRHTLGEMPAACRSRAVYLPENGIDPMRFNRIAEQCGQGPLRACFIGRMVPYKGPDMLIEAALPLLKAGTMRLDMIGDGPMLPDLKTMVERHAVGDRVIFHGWVTHHRVQDIAVANEIFAFPSIREFGGGAVLEALALGIVPVIVDYAGPGELVDETTAFKIPIGSRREIVESYQRVLNEIYNNRSVLTDMAARGQALIRDRFTWSRKAEQIAAVYDTVLRGKEVATSIAL